MFIFPLSFLYFSSAIPLLGFLLELAYCQNFLGLIWFSGFRGEDLNVKVYDVRRTPSDGKSFG
jgi:hypothetical protein